MLTVSQKITLIKKVDRYALSDMRIKALTDLKEQFSIEDVKEIASLTYLRDETVLRCLS